MAHLRRRPGEHPVLAARSDHGRELRHAARRVAVPHRQLRSAARSSRCRRLRSTPTAPSLRPSGRAARAVSIDPASGELLWSQRFDERPRTFPRGLSGRGVAYWESGATRRVLMVTPGYQLLAIDARSGDLDPGFGDKGVVDMRRQLTYDVPDFDKAEIGLHTAPIVASGIIVVGSAHLPGGAPPTKEHIKGVVSGFDARTGKKLWTLHRHSRPRPAGQRHVAQRVVDVHRQRRVVGADVGRRTTRARLRAGRGADGRLLRRASPRRQPVLELAGRARREDRQAGVALPDDAPRHLGLGHAERAHPGRHHRRRPRHQGRGRAHQAELPLRVRSHHGPAGLADRRSAGAQGRPGR